MSGSHWSVAMGRQDETSLHMGTDLALSFGPRSMFSKAGSRESCGTRIKQTEMQIAKLSLRFGFRRPTMAQPFALGTYFWPSLCLGVLVFHV